MKNFKNKKGLQIVLGILIAVLTLGIGYASISAINLTINGNATASVNQENFKVYFVPTADTPSLTGNVNLTGSAIIDGEDNTIAHFNVSGLTKEGDYALATYTIINNSEAIGADITLKVTNSNPDYFNVIETITDSQLQAGDTTTGTIKVEMVKTPIDTDVSTSVTGTLTASPLENAQATGSGPKSKKAIPDPVSFGVDSWKTIQAAVQDNNTSAYHVGDTKKVKINGNDYTVRIANMTSSPNCTNENYSETACGFVVEFAEIVERNQMYIDSNNRIGGWINTDLYPYMQNEFYNKLPSDLKSVIIPTRVISGGPSATDIYITTEKTYLLSGVEVFGSDNMDPVANTTTQLEYYQGMESETINSWPYTVYPRTYKGYNGGDGTTRYVEYWLLRIDTLDDPRFFRDVRLGSLSYASPTELEGIAPAFRIG